MRKELTGAVILKKNKDYNSVQEAQVFYENQRLNQLAVIIFKDEWLPKGFKENVQYLMKYQNPVQMQVWYNKQKRLTNKETGEQISTTWETLCYFNRPFVCAEIYQCLEILKRATPNELYNFERCENYLLNQKKDIKEINESDAILIFFNEVAYPEIEAIAEEVQTILDEVEEQVCKPIRDKINADLKAMKQMAVGSNVEFIKGKERKM